MERAQEVARYSYLYVYKNHKLFPALSLPRSTSRPPTAFFHSTLSGYPSALHSNVTLRLSIACITWSALVIWTWTKEQNAINEMDHTYLEPGKWRGVGWLGLCLGEGAPPEPKKSWPYFKPEKQFCLLYFRTNEICITTKTAWFYFRNLRSNVDTRWISYDPWIPCKNRTLCLIFSSGNYTLF